MQHTLCTVRAPPNRPLVTPQEARTFGDFLLVGIHDDATINGLRGHGLPVLNL
jgi:hypothetical protein